MVKKIPFVMALCGLLCFLVVSGVLAQTNPLPSPDTPLQEADGEDTLPVIDDIPDSLFFNSTQIAAISRAISGFQTALPGGEETDSEDGEVRPAREIKLAGIVYVSSDIWTIWLNDRRIIPGHSLPEIVNLKVDRRKIYLEWYDEITGKVIAITLRPHQTYNIDTGLLLPG